jgi:hypothetical protein
MSYKPRNAGAAKLAKEAETINRQFEKLIQKYPELSEMQASFNELSDGALHRIDKPEDAKRRPKYGKS